MRVTLENPRVARDIPYTLQVTDKMFRNLFFIPMDMLYALIAKLGFIAELWDFPTLKRTTVERKSV